MLRISSLFATVILAACAANPVATAVKATPENRPETVAFALHNSYVVLAERAAAIASDSTTPRGVKKALVNLYTTATPVVKHLRDVAVQYRKVREAYDAGSGTLASVASALAALNSAITESAPLVNAVAKEIGGKSP